MKKITEKGNTIYIMTKDGYIKKISKEEYYQKKSLEFWDKFGFLIGMGMLTIPAIIVGIIYGLKYGFEIGFGCGLAVFIVTFSFYYILTVAWFVGGLGKQG